MASVERLICLYFRRRFELWRGWHPEPTIQKRRSASCEQQLRQGPFLRSSPSASRCLASQSICAIPEDLGIDRVEAFVS